MCSLSSGLTAADDDGVNCDQTELVGAKIHKQLDKVSAIDASIKRSDQVRSLDHLHPGIKVDKKKVHINPTLLFYCGLMLLCPLLLWSYVAVSSVAVFMVLCCCVPLLLCSWSYVAVFLCCYVPLLPWSYIVVVLCCCVPLLLCSSVTMVLCCSGLMLLCPLLQWTLMSYMIEGGGSPTLSRAKAWLYRHQEASHRLLQAITSVSVDYLVGQVEAGAQLLQVFESHAGLMGRALFLAFSLPYLQQIARKVKEKLKEKGLDPVPMVNHTLDVVLLHHVRDYLCSGGVC